MIRRVPEQALVWLAVLVQLLVLAVMLPAAYVMVVRVWIPSVPLLAVVGVMLLVQEMGERVRKESARHLENGGIGP